MIPLICKSGALNRPPEICMPVPVSVSLWKTNISKVVSAEVRLQIVIWRQSRSVYAGKIKLREHGVGYLLKQSWDSCIRIREMGGDRWDSVSRISISSSMANLHSLPKEAKRTDTVETRTRVAICLRSNSYANSNLSNFLLVSIQNFAVAVEKHSIYFIRIICPELTHYFLCVVYSFLQFFYSDWLFCSLLISVRYVLI